MFILLPFVYLLQDGIGHVGYVTVKRVVSFSVVAEKYFVIMLV